MPEPTTRLESDAYSRLREAIRQAQSNNPDLGVILTLRDALYTSTDVHTIDKTTAYLWLADQLQ